MASPEVLYQAGNHAGRPANGSGCVLYSCTDHDLVYRDDGTSWTTFMTLIGGSGGDIATDTIWDAAGDLAVGTGANTAARLAIGASGTLLQSNGTTAAWVAPGTYSDWTPALTADTTNPTLGTGSSVSGRYTQVGKQVHAYGNISFGTSGVAAGNGVYEVQFPVTARTPTQSVLGSGTIYDASANIFKIVAAYVQDTGEFRFMFPDSTSLNVTNVAPWTWAASDQISFNLTYEAA